MPEQTIAQGDPDLVAFIERAFQIRRRVLLSSPHDPDLVVTWRVSEVRYAELCRAAKPNDAAVWLLDGGLRMFGHVVLRTPSPDDPELLELVIADRRLPL